MIAGILLTFGWSSLLVFVGGRDKQLRYRTGWLTAAVILLASVAVWGGNSSIRLSDDPGSENIASSSGISMIKTVYSAVLRGHDRVPARAVDSATRRAGWFNNLPAKRNVVLVIVESWGQASDPGWSEAITAPLRDPKITARYDVQSGTVPFRGPTVPAEFRELCGVLSAVTERPTDDLGLMQNCLPNQLSSRGYRTTFLHGFDPNMFNRGSWSRKLGFQQLLFRHDLQQLGIRKCDGPFAGACDDDVARWIGDQLVADPTQSQMFYLLTLNSHLPIRSPEGMGNPLRCGTKEAKITDEASCDLLTLILRVHVAFSNVAVRPDLPPTEFLLVGDHAPPFLYKFRREQFSQTEVPFVHLTPRQSIDQVRTSRK